jgi:hypothetical protein
VELPGTKVGTETEKISQHKRRESFGLPEAIGNERTWNMMLDQEKTTSKIKPVMMKP